MERVDFGRLTHDDGTCDSAAGYHRNGVGDGGLEMSEEKREKIKKVMREFERGTLRSGSKRGPVVRDRKQALAIALSEARRAVSGAARRGKRKPRRRGYSVKACGMIL